MRNNSSVAQRSQQQYLDVCLPSGRNECLGFQICSKLNVSGPWLFLIQGHWVLVSINTEINTTLQSALFINGVIHLMRALLTHINLPSRRGPSRNYRQLPACIYSVLAFGKSGHSVSTFSLQKRENIKPQDSRWAQKHSQVLRTILLAFSGYCFLFILFYFVSGSQTAMDGFLLKLYKISPKQAKALIKIGKGKT